MVRPPSTLSPHVGGSDVLQCDAPLPCDGDGARRCEEDGRAPFPCGDWTLKAGSARSRYRAFLLRTPNFKEHSYPSYVATRKIYIVFYDYSQT